MRRGPGPALWGSLGPYDFTPQGRESAVRPSTSHLTRLASGSASLWFGAPSGSASSGSPESRSQTSFSRRSPAATAVSSVFPGGGNGQMKWSAKAHGGSSARLRSTVTEPSAAGAGGRRKRKR